jgi:hypothetical protein
MLILGRTCALLAGAVKFIVWFNDRRRAWLHQDPFTALAHDEPSALQFDGQGKG